MAEGSAEIIFVCGGTGGHLAPGIAMAQRFIEKGERVLLVVSRKPVDTKMLEKYPDLPRMVVPGAAFSFHPRKIFSSFLNLWKNSWAAFNLLRRRHPSSVFCFGGFLTPGFALSCVYFRIPLFFHEANRVPGRAIRLFGRFGTRVYLPFGVGLPSVARSKRHAAGLPLRREVKHIRKDDIRQKMGILRHRKVLLVIGGSQGAQSLNRWFNDNLSRFTEDGVLGICVTGDRTSTPKICSMTSSSGDVFEHQMLPFHDDIPSLMSAADIAISRAGAGSIAEAVVTLTPTILVPYPFAADQHQEVNARYLEKRGAAVVISDDNLNCLYNEMQELLFNDWLLSKMRSNLRSLNSRDAGDHIFQDWFSCLSTLTVTDSPTPQEVSVR